MTPERWRRVTELFQSAVAQSVETRAAFLDEACAEDGSLRWEVEALLAADSKEEGVLEEIASGLAADWAAENDGHGLVGKTLGRYQVFAALGSGGMGEVYLAQDTTLDRKVALKLLPRRFTRDRDRLRRFEQEARAASALNHPNIITIYEVGEWDGARFIATEYVEGKTLGEQMQNPDRPLSLILDIGIQAAGALAAAHAAGIVHRDIKPANIMLRADGYIKVLDFGLAKLMSTRTNLDVTDPGRVMGTINYMSPEQAMGQELDYRTDVFSLGVVLYEIATGHRLFEGKSEAAIYDRILHQPAPPLREFAPTLPVELDQVIRRALEKNPAQRYQSAADLRADLKLLAQGGEQTQAAKIISAAQRKRRWRLAAVALPILALVAALFFGVKFAGNNRPTVLPNELSEKSIAVLPFENLNRDQENSFFADGVQDQVLTDLAKISQLKVISRTSVMQYRSAAPRNLRRIGRELGVTFLLEGSVQRAGGRVRVNAQLINAQTDAHLWAETYEGDLVDVFAIQSRIARTIAQQLRAKLSPSERAEIEEKPTSNVAAFESYTRGKILLDAAANNENPEENYRAAVALLTQAVERDPTFLGAYCSLARAHDSAYLSGIDHTNERLALGQAAVESARRLAPNAGETHLAAAMHLYARLDYARAREELNAARITLPGDPATFALSGYVNRRQGRWEESTRDFERVLEVEPYNVDVMQDLALNYSALGANEKWAAILDRAIALRPERIPLRLSRAFIAFYLRGDTRPWRELLEEIHKLDPASSKTFVGYRIALAFFERNGDEVRNALPDLGDGRWGTDAAHFSRAFSEGLLARLQGDEAAAHAAFAADRVAQERIVQAQPEYGPAISMLGLIDAGLGRKEDALREGRRAVELLPISTDAVNGPPMMINLAIIAAWVGDKDLAIEQLRLVNKISGGVDYGHLKLDPLWDPLRGDPRFQEIVASLAPTGAR